MKKLLLLLFTTASINIAAQNTLVQNTSGQNIVDQRTEEQNSPSNSIAARSNAAQNTLGINNGVQNNKYTMVEPGSFSGVVTKKVDSDYLIYFPDGYSLESREVWPMLVFLHGSYFPLNVHCTRTSTLLRT